MPVHTCRRKHNKATTASEKQCLVWRDRKGGTKGYEARTEGATHNQGDVQHTQKQKTQTKHAQATTTAPAAETQVQVCYVPRYATLRYGKSTTITTPTKVTKRCGREIVPSPARQLA